MQHEELTKIIIGCAYTVHNTLGAGFLEKVYENALCLELKKQGLDAIQQLPIKVYYNNQIVGDYYADIMVNNIIILKLKAVDILHPIHETQLVNYLNATRIDIGLLINFGRSVEVKRKFRLYTKTKI
ncbi:MAG: GxxExxY protein [Chitinophagales bacterium]|jgi:GxxExxY protein|nr:GxxExxY protein [Chitinophagales bacterium]